MMDREPAKVSRRRFLKGSQALVALPFLESVAPAATAKAGPPLRMCALSVTGGTVIESWKPSQTGALPHELPSILRPLERHREDLLVVSGLSQSGRGRGLNAHQHCASLHFTCADEVRKEDGAIKAPVSFDQVAVGHNGSRTFLPYMSIGLGHGETIYSYREDGRPVGYEDNPRLVFDQMFRGARQPVSPNWKRRRNSPATAETSSIPPSRRRSVVDLVLSEAKSLERDLGREDQTKLDEYFTSIRSIENRIEAQERILREEALDSKNPGPTPPLNPHGLPETLAEGNNLARAVGRDPDKHGEYIRIMQDLTILALQTDTTRVVTTALGSDGALFPGVVTVGYEHHAHTLEHHGNARRIEDADPIAREGCRQIHAWYTSLFAEMVDKMKAIDEGGSSLLDNTMLLYTSYMANGGHGRKDYPYLLVGNAQGTIRTGRHVAYQEDTPAANLYVEMLNRMGIHDGRFGNSHTSPKAAYDGRLPDLG